MVVRACCLLPQAAGPLKQAVTIMHMKAVIGQHRILIIDAVIHNWDTLLNELHVEHEQGCFPDSKYMIFTVSAFGQLDVCIYKTSNMQSDFEIKQVLNRHGIKNVLCDKPN